MKKAGKSLTYPSYRRASRGGGALPEKRHRSGQFLYTNRGLSLCLNVNVRVEQYGPYRFVFVDNALLCAKVKTLNNILGKQPGH